MPLIGRSKTVSRLGGDRHFDIDNRLKSTKKKNDISRLTLPEVVMP